MAGKISPGAQRMLALIRQAEKQKAVLAYAANKAFKKCQHCCYYRLSGCVYCRSRSIRLFQKYSQVKTQTVSQYYPAKCLTKLLSRCLGTCSSSRCAACLGPWFPVCQLALLGNRRNTSRLVVASQAGCWGRPGRGHPGTSEVFPVKGNIQNVGCNSQGTSQWAP